MNEGLIPRRYAKALYKFALEKGQDKPMYALMQKLSKAFVSDLSLQEVMCNPFIDNNDKVTLLKIASGADESISSFFDFLKLLIENKRISFIRSIALAYLTIYRKANNIYLVEVVSATTMDEADQARLHKLIEKHLNGGSMEYSQRVDSQLIGGFVVNIDSERLDASVQNELKQLRLNLLRK
jgi:F-type H+-transporting ATPase subunit delta